MLYEYGYDNATIFNMIYVSDNTIRVSTTIQYVLDMDTGLYI